jgi:Integrase core domain
MDLTECQQALRFLLHDCDSKVSAAFDEVFRTEGALIVKTPIRAPNANAFAERWVRTVRDERLDWLLIVGHRQLQRVLDTYVDHYNRERPHLALGLVAPDPPREVAPAPQRKCAEGTGSADCRMSTSSQPDDRVYAPYAHYFLTEPGMGHRFQA